MQLGLLRNTWLHNLHVHRSSPGKEERKGCPRQRSSQCKGEMSQHLSEICGVPSANAKVQGMCCKELRGEPGNADNV